MKLDKIWNSKLGIVLAVLATLIAVRTVRMASWTILKIGGYAVLAGIVVLAIRAVRKQN